MPDGSDSLQQCELLCDSDSVEPPYLLRTSLR